MTVAGTTAIVVGAAATAVGLLATPALADASLTYNCTATIPNTDPLTFDLTAAVTGSVNGTPQVGDPVELTGFTVTADATVPGLSAFADQASGQFTSFPVSASAGDGTNAGSADPGGQLPIEADVADGGVLHFTTPDSGLTLTGFAANAPGRLSISAGTIAANLTLTKTNPDTGEVSTTAVTLDCTGGGEIASVDVPEPAQTTTSAPPTDTNPQGGDDNHNGNNGNNGNHQQTASNPASTSAPAGTTPATLVRNVSARGTLANTGAPYTVPMTATGAALLLLGAGLLVTGRRRRVAPEGMTEQD